MSKQAIEAAAAKAELPTSWARVPLPHSADVDLCADCCGSLITWYQDGQDHD